MFFRMFFVLNRVRVSNPQRLTDHPDHPFLNIGQLLPSPVSSERVYKSASLQVCRSAVCGLRSAVCKSAVCVCRTPTKTAMLRRLLFSPCRHLHVSYTVKPLLSRHLRDLPKCPLNKGCKHCTMFVTDQNSALTLYCDKVAC